jgi:leader peptidase (prepilin peptidase)/N-methyltransferase
MEIIIALAGLAVGALVNRLADQLPRYARDPLRRSQRDRALCDQCGQLRWRITWLPVISYLLQRGRCQHCGARLPLRDVVVQVTMALVLAAIWMRYAPDPGPILLAAVYATVFMLITVIDWEHRLILDVVILPAIGIALLLTLIAPGWLNSLFPELPQGSASGWLIGGAIGLGAFFLVWLFGQRVYGPGAFGQGDIKLAAFIGLITGFPLVVVALASGILAGGVISLLLVATRIRSMRSYIPYGPFLIVGAAIALWSGPEILRSWLGPR